MLRSISFGWKVALTALGFCGYVSLNVQAQEVMTDFKMGPPSGAYAFASSTPKALPDLLKSGASAEAVNIVGHLFLPQGSGKVPVVVLMHGSGGIYDAMLDYWPKLLNAQGMAVFSLDRFGPRGVKSTAEDQSQVPFAADVADGFAALRARRRASLNESAEPLRSSSANWARPSVPNASLICIWFCRSRATARASRARPKAVWVSPCLRIISERLPRQRTCMARSCPALAKVNESCKSAMPAS